MLILEPSQTRCWCWGHWGPQEPKMLQLPIFMGRWIMEKEMDNGRNRVSDKTSHRRSHLHWHWRDDYEKPGKNGGSRNCSRLGERSRVMREHDIFVQITEDVCLTFILRGAGVWQMSWERWSGMDYAGPCRGSFWNVVGSGVEWLGFHFK